MENKFESPEKLERDEKEIGENSNERRKKTFVNSNFIKYSGGLKRKVDFIKESQIDRKENDQNNLDKNNN